jgi:hypothetical protein
MPLRIFQWVPKIYCGSPQSDFPALLGALPRPTATPFVVWENLTLGSEFICCGYPLKVTISQNYR